MDVSFSAWRHSREESLQLKGDSFSFLFDRRYTNRLNRMSRVFFEAYVVATKELAAQEDRFPSLSEIDAKMESGAVYAFKDRLMKNTEFFEEVKISGVSYLVPRALKFVDSTGTYTDLILNFDEGAVVLPTRRKTPSLAEPTVPPTEEGEAASFETEEDIEFSAEPEDKAAPEPRPESYSRIFEKAANTTATEDEEADLPEPPVAKAEEAAPPKPSATATFAPSSGKEPPSLPAKGRMSKEMIVAALAGLIMLMALGGYILSGGFPSNSSSKPLIFVDYSAYLINSSNESYLGFDISNPHGMPNLIEMKLPSNIDESISARGGIVTIAHGTDTLVRMNTSTDASVKIYLLNNWSQIPLTLNFSGTEDYDTSLQVHSQDYLVTRKNDTLILSLNLTGDGVKFEQSYAEKS
ncbi:MAG TPA: hypothetical protein PKK68_03505 [Methanothrix soehngenii]|nr:hypothetical protein [Methanothrix soehngenii]